MVHEISHADKCADQGRGNGQSVYRPQHTAVRYLAREDIEGNEYAYRTAVAGQSAFPYFENVERVGRVIFPAIEEAVSQSRTDDGGRQWYR